MSTFKYGLGATITDAHPAQFTASSWAAFVQVFDAPESERSQAKGGRYICGPMENGRRSKANAINSNWLAHDFDKLTASHIAPLTDWFASVALGLWYRTASDTSESPRLRVILALDRDVTPSERKALCERIGGLLGEHYPRDTCQDNAEQAAYLPTQGAIVTSFGIVPLIVDSWLAFSPTPRVQTSAPALRAAEWTDTPAAEWHGCTDDADLIKKALIQRPDSASIFGGAVKFATFEQLYYANSNELALALIYPSNTAGAGFDRSRADAALAKELSYWAGKDCTRIERLMRASDLMRDKWDSHASYLHTTIVKACAACVSVDGAKLTAPGAHEVMALQIGTQDSIALTFAMTYQGQMLYNHSASRWMKWDGISWCADYTDSAFNYARELARAANYTAKLSLGSAAFCKGVEDFAKSDPRLAATGDRFDADNYLLNMPNGTLDLRTGVLSAPCASNLITHCTAASPSTTGGAIFRKFLDEITCGDTELATFLQVSLGACLSGAVESHWMLFWIGQGRNGKNTLGDLVQDALGSYARKVPSSTLMARKYEGHPTEIANLQGVRLATSSEINEGDFWDESRINEITGDATLSARFMRGDLFTFSRTHKHLIYGNHRPQLRACGAAIKSRLKIVPFKASFIGREDADLPRRLRLEIGYVLHWLIDGHRAWMGADKRLPQCAAVEAESADYFASQSTVEAWLTERVQIIGGVDDRIVRDLPKAGELYADYKQWKIERGEIATSLTRFGGSLQGFEKVVSAGIRYRNLILSPHAAITAAFR